MSTTKMGNWTVNIEDYSGEALRRAKGAGYRSYRADGVTAIEVGYCSKGEARRRAAQFGAVLHIYE